MDTGTFIDMEAQLYHLHTWVRQTDPEILKGSLQPLLEQSGMHIVGYTEHAFQPQGFTAVWLLAESHLALHTFPESGKSAIDLGCCNRAAFDAFQKALFATFPEAASITA